MLKVYILLTILRIKVLDQPHCSLHKGQSLTLVRGLTFLPLLMNYLEFQIHFTQAVSLWWDLKNAPLTIAEKPSEKKFSKASQKGQKWKYQFHPFPLEFFEIFYLFRILRYGLPIETLISEPFRHFYFWPLCYGLQNAFLTDLAWQPLLRTNWGWGKIIGHDLIYWILENTRMTNLLTIKSQVM